MSNENGNEGRRRFAQTLGSGIAVAVAGCRSSGAARQEAAGDHPGPDEGVSPGEDLMREHALFGERGFREAVGEVAGLEAALGIQDLARFTAG